MTTITPEELSAALGWPGGISTPVLDKTELLQMVAQGRTQQEQEPVAWMVYTLDGNSVCVTDNPADFTEKHRALPLYTHPLRREWQGLSEEDLDAVLPYCHNKYELREYMDLARDVEAKLKERNKA